MDQQERIEALEEAREAIYQAIESIRFALRGTPAKRYAEAYIIPSLAMCASSDHEYLGSQPANIDELIDALQDDEDEA